MARLEGWTASSQGRRPEIYVYRIEIQEVEILYAEALEVGECASSRACTGNGPTRTPSR